MRNKIFGRLASQETTWFEMGKPGDMPRPEEALWEKLTARKQTKRPKPLMGL
jgi:hypothetical protein